MPRADFEKIWNDTEAELAGNTPADTGTPDPAPADGETPPAGTEAGTTDSSGTPAPDPQAAAANPVESFDVDDFKFEEFRKANPEAAKAYQSALTKMRQKDSEKLKAYEGVEEQDAQVLRQYKQALREDPARAVEWLKQQAQEVEQKLLGRNQPQTPAEPDPLDTYVPQSDGEFFLLQQMKHMREQVQERHSVVDQLAQQNQQAAYQARVESEFNALQSKVKRDISPTERQQIHDYAAQNRFPTLEAAYKVMNFEKAQELAADQAASVVTRKANTGPVPGGVTPRSSGEETPAPKNMKEGLLHEFRQAGMLK